MKILLFLLFFAGFANAQKACGFKDGLQEGNCLFYYESGQLQWNQNWKKGKLEGDYLAYFENGKLKAKGTYEKDKKVGEWIYFDETGAKTGMEKYVSWKKNVYRDDGEITYYKNGKINTKGKFMNGVAEGERFFYKEDGTLDRTEIYKDGKVISTK